MGLQVLFAPYPFGLGLLFFSPVTNNFFRERLGPIKMKKQKQTKKENKTKKSGVIS